MKSRFSLILCGMLLFCSAVHAKEVPPAFEVGGVKVEAWLPQDSVPKPWPVIIFSHGFHGCNVQSVFLMQALADAGYAVFAPNHHDAACNGGEGSWLNRSQVSFKEPDKWSDATYADRRDDIEKLLSLLPSDPRFHELDWKHIGLAGHSLGGYTVLALAGAWPGWKDARVKAVLALSPYSEPFITQQTLKNIHIPVMYQGGTRDFGITPSLNKNGGAYDMTAAPKYFINLQGAGHFAWTDLRNAYHAVIDDYSIAFFDTYLKGKPFPQTLMEKGKNVSELKTDAGK